MRSLSETGEVEVANKTKDEIFMDEALQLAERAGRMGEVPVGALVVLEGKVIGAAGNASIKNSDPTAHAEMLAIKQASLIWGTTGSPVPLYMSPLSHALCVWEL